MRELTLRPLAGRLAICRLGPAEAIPDWLGHSGFCSVTRTPEELSIVTDEDRVPAAVRAERGWRALVVAGPLAFTETGILASLAAPLAEAGISLFALSTFETDYLLVPAGRFDEALDALRSAGCRIGAGQPG